MIAARKFSYFKLNVLNRSLFKFKKNCNDFVLNIIIKAKCAESAKRFYCVGCATAGGGKHRRGSYAYQRTLMRKIS